MVNKEEILIVVGEFEYEPGRRATSYEPARIWKKIEVRMRVKGGTATAEFAGPDPLGAAIDFLRSRIRNDQSETT